MADLSNTNTATRFSVIQPDLLPPMKVLESVDVEQILSNRMDQFLKLWLAHDPPNRALYDVGGTEFDPIVINQELNSFFEMTVRDRVNQACRSITLAFSSGTDIDAIASRYPGGVPRLEGESDSAYRRRIWLSVNPLSPHGATESYQFWALSALPAGALRDASTIKVRPDLKSDPIIVVTCLANNYSNPRPTDAQLIQVKAYVRDPSRMAMTDIVFVNPPKVVTTRYHVRVWLLPGPETQTIISGVRDKLNTLIQNQFWLGVDHTRMAIAAACAVSGVYNVDIVEPAEDVFVTPDYVVQVTDLTVEYMGRRE